MRARDRVAVALDVPGRAEALQLARSLRGRVGWVKVGLELFTAAGPTVVEPLAELGFRVFLDLKLHDIPNTVAGAVRAAARLPVLLLTVHTGGGAEMMRSAARAAHSSGLRLVGVTVLTSLDQASLVETGVEVRDLAELALTRGHLAQTCGLDGVVCSPEEVAAMRAALGPAAWLVVPGIRPEGTASGDQRRVGTPEAAMRDGATLLVVGRAITQAADPAAAAEHIVASLEDATRRQGTDAERDG